MCTLTFILAKIGPGRLDTRQGALVNGISIGKAKLEEHFTCDVSTIKHLWFDTLEYFLPQTNHLLDKFRSETIIGDLLKALKVFFFF